MTSLRRSALLLPGTLLIASVTLPVTARAALSVPTMNVVAVGHSTIYLDVTAGASGAPGGFTVQYMEKADWDVLGWAAPNYRVVTAFVEDPSLNTFGGTTTTFTLDPSQKARVEVGDTFDEEGLWASSYGELDPGTEYVFRVKAEATDTDAASAFSPNTLTSSQGKNPDDCTFTQGYWKNHPSAWPVSSVKLGTVTYTKTQLLQIFGQPAKGNGLVSLAHQLIAARLNIANGASVTVAVSTALAQADALIGNKVVPPIGSGSLTPSSTSALTETLDQYNSGLTGPGHCADGGQGGGGPVPVIPTTWGTIKATYR